MRRLTTGAVALALLIAAAATAPAQTTFDIPAAKDNTLYEDSLGALSNGAGIYLFTGRTDVAANGKLRRGLVAFD
ncbi:MAG: hypothetical protein GY778_07075, partial [bacterium]|nr:hypothetical protein [bacterium]